MPVRGGVCVVSALLLVATLTTCAEFSQLEEEDVSVPTRGFTPDDLPEINLNLTAVKHHAGEAARHFHHLVVRGHEQAVLGLHEPRDRRRAVDLHVERLVREGGGA